MGALVGTGQRPGIVETQSHGCLYSQSVAEALIDLTRPAGATGDKGVFMSKRILIVGRGAAGSALANDIARRSDSVVVGYLDDRSGHGEVLGRLGDAERVIAAELIDIVYVAIPSISAARLREFLGEIAHLSVELAVIPRTYQILTKETVNIDDLTDVDVLDLVGREPVKHDLVEAQQFLREKSVLVTGAAGSIGSRLVRQAVAMGATSVVCVDWWENGMFYLSEELADSENVAYQIADIRSEPRMQQIFEQHRPDIVFHAAAYKHVPLMQANAVEAVNNNVGGTLNLMRAAVAAGVGNFVMVSSDKAVNPANVMGATKRLGELALRELAATTTTTQFNAVRFGNVIQSNGSVMQTFRKQIAARKPLTVTHRDITRFFMTVDEASQLVIQSSFAGESGDLFVLDMGEPVRIFDLARSLIDAVDPSLHIEIIGLRPGEKMFEELSYEPEKVRVTANQKIFVVRDEAQPAGTPTLDQIDSLVALSSAYSIDDEGVIFRLRGFGFAVHDASAP